MILDSYIIITQNNRRDIFFGSLVIKNGRISKIIEKDLDIRKIRGVISPGFINIHAHLGELFFRGNWPKINLPRYIKETEKINSAIKDKESFRAIIARVTLSEMISNGTTTVVGGRTSDAQKFFGINGISFVPFMKTDKLQKFYQLSEKEIKKATREQPGIFIHSLKYIDPEKLQSLAKVIKEKKLFLAIHTSEDPIEYQDFKEEHGMTEVQLLDSIGLINDKTILIHCNNCSPEDMKIIEKKKANIVTCPISNQRLSGKLLSIDNLLKNNNISISTDGPATNDSLDLLPEVKFSFLNNNKLSSQDLFDTVTRNPAKAIGKFNEVGSIEVGKFADLVIFDYNSRLFPIKNLVNNLVLTAPTIRSVVSKGKYIFKDHDFVKEYNNIIKEYLVKLEYIYEETTSSIN